MKAETLITTYQRLRGEPLWRLLASDHGPIIVGLLQTHLYDNDRTLSASILHERIARDLKDLQSSAYPLQQTAQAYVADWLNNGYLERRFRPGAIEEEYELSTSTVEAIRLLSSLVQPYTVATESRLALVINALGQLVEETDSDKAKRIERLFAERERIDKEIEAIQQGQLTVLSKITALERIREIIKLADEMTEDFRRVRDQFEQLNRNLREKLVENEGNRGQVLDSLFTGIDLISDSDAGRTFSAFWRLLTDPEQSASLRGALDNIMQREFISELQAPERRFLLRLTRNLLERGGQVHEVMQTFARSLKTFVQSREYLEHQRLNQLIKKSLHAALLLKDDVKARDSLAYTLTLTSSRLRSLSQWVLFDPSLQAIPEAMSAGEAATIDLNSISELVAQSEIDFRSLKANVCAVLEQHAQASISDILAIFPANQGLGSIIGLIALASRHGQKTPVNETITWIGNDDIARTASIPKLFFLQERASELA